LCFNELDKLRTVIWDFGGEALTPEDLGALETLARALPAEVSDLLSPPEVAALLDRVAWLLHLQALPELVDDGDWPPYPWPLV
jgi:hypothetical protein